MPELGSIVAEWVRDFAEQEMPDLADLVPFFHGIWTVEGYVADRWIAFRLISRAAGGNIVVLPFKTSDLQRIKSIVAASSFRTYEELNGLLGDEWYGFRRFSYVGPQADGSVSLEHLREHVSEWLRQIVSPRVLSLNNDRVLRVLPKPPTFDLAAVGNSLWVLESELEPNFKQGTAFALAGAGLVTCDHVLDEGTHAFRPNQPLTRRTVTVVARNADIDLAIVQIGDDLGKGLERGTADQLKEWDHVAVAGFPNFHVGDTCMFTPGLVIGFRPVRGIRRLLTNAPIVAGNSGGPVLGRETKVVGVAVTGADIREKAPDTENHGIIPIDALGFLGQTVALSS